MCWISNSSVSLFPRTRFLSCHVGLPCKAPFVFVKWKWSVSVSVIFSFVWSKGGWGLRGCLLIWRSCPDRPTSGARCVTTTRWSSLGQATEPANDGTSRRRSKRVVWMNWKEGYLRSSDTVCSYTQTKGWDWFWLVLLLSLSLALLLPSVRWWVIISWIALLYSEAIRSTCLTRWMHNVSLF